MSNWIKTNARFLAEEEDELANLLGKESKLYEYNPFSLNLDKVCGFNPSEGGKNTTIWLESGDTFMITIEYDELNKILKL